MWREREREFSEIKKIERLRKGFGKFRIIEEDSRREQEKKKSRIK